MLEIKREKYSLLLSFNPCEIFEHFKVKELHGLSCVKCKSYNNTTEDAYIAGLTNISPVDGEHFVFINLSRCIDDIRTFGLIFHEMMHLSLELNEFNVKNKEEEIISWAENETYINFNVIKDFK